MNQKALLLRPPLWLFVAAFLAASVGGWLVGARYVDLRLLLLIAGGVACLATGRRLLAKSAGLIVLADGLWALYKSVEMFEDRDPDRYIARILGLVFVAIGAFLFFIERAGLNHASCDARWPGRHWRGTSG
jgi:hypothetical protein